MKLFSLRAKAKARETAPRITPTMFTAEQLRAMDEQAGRIRAQVIQNMRTHRLLSGAALAETGKLPRRVTSTSAIGANEKAIIINEEAAKRTQTTRMEISERIKQILAEKKKAKLAIESISGFAAEANSTIPSIELLRKRMQQVVTAKSISQASNLCDVKPRERDEALLQLRKLAGNHPEYASIVSGFNIISVPASIGVAQLFKQNPGSSGPLRVKRGPQDFRDVNKYIGKNKAGDVLYYSAPNGERIEVAVTEQAMRREAAEKANELQTLISRIRLDISAKEQESLQLQGKITHEAEELKVLTGVLRESPRMDKLARDTALLPEGIAKIYAFHNAGKK
jgi:hypothetical protein